LKGFSKAVCQPKLAEASLSVQGTQCFLCQGGMFCCKKACERLSNCLEETDLNVNDVAAQYPGWLDYLTNLALIYLKFGLVCSLGHIFLLAW